MKQTIIKCTRQQLQRLIRLSCLAATLLLMVLSAPAQHNIPRSLPEAPVGGPGGSEFVARCPPGQFLAGVELRAGDDIDAIRPLCRTASVHNEKVPLEPGDPKYNPYAYDQYREIKSYYVTEAASVTGWYGGPGGSIKSVVCTPGAGNIAQPVVSAIYIEAEGIKTVTVNRITLLCEGLTYGGPTEFRDREFWKDIHPNDKSVVDFEAPKNSANEIIATSICPVSLDNFATMAVGIRGRSGVWLDAVGLICDYLKPPLAPVALGRVQSTGPKDPPMSICDRARDARARNSPAAPSLEAQCSAARDKLPPVALGRVQSTTPKGAPLSICARARAARARNSPSAPALEAQCRAAGAAGETPQIVGPAIIASPNPVVVPNGQTVGTTTITWKAGPDYTYSEIYLSVDNGEWTEFARGSDNAKSMTIKLGSSYTFRMMVYEGQAGTPKIITTLTLAPAKN